MQTPLIINEALSRVLPPHAPDELLLLEASLLENGCRDALLVWEETGILLDGHARLAICERRGIPYTLRYKSLGAFTPETLETAKLEIIKLQVGRCNRADLVDLLKEKTPAVPGR